MIMVKVQNGNLLNKQQMKVSLNDNEVPQIMILLASRTNDTAFGIMATMERNCGASKHNVKDI